MSKSRATVQFLTVQVIATVIGFNLFASPVDVVQAESRMKDYTNDSIVGAVQDLKDSMELRFKEQEKLFREIAERDKD